METNTRSKAAPTTCVARGCGLMTVSPRTRNCKCTEHRVVPGKHPVQTETRKPPKLGKTDTTCAGDADPSMPTYRAQKEQTQMEWSTPRQRIRGVFTTSGMFTARSQLHWTHLSLKPPSTGTASNSPLDHPLSPPLPLCTQNRVWPSLFCCFGPDLSRPDRYRPELFGPICMRIFLQQAISLASVRDWPAEAVLQKTEGAVPGRKVQAGGALAWSGSAWGRQAWGCCGGSAWGGPAVMADFGQTDFGQLCA